MARNLLTHTEMQRKATSATPRLGCRFHITGYFPQEDRFSPCQGPGSGLRMWVGAPSERWGRGEAPRGEEGPAEPGSSGRRAHGGQETGGTGARGQQRRTKSDPRLTLCPGRSRGPRGEGVAGGHAGTGAEPPPLRADEGDWRGGELTDVQDPGSSLSL